MSVAVGRLKGNVDGRFGMGSGKVPALHLAESDINESRRHKETIERMGRQDIVKCESS